MANIERRNALYSSLYEDTHDLKTGGFNDTEAGQLYKSTGNTATPYTFSGSKQKTEPNRPRSEWAEHYIARKGLNPQPKQPSSPLFGNSNPKADEVYANVDDLYSQYKAGDLSYQAFMQNAGMSPEMWEQRAENQRRKEQDKKDKEFNNAVNSSIIHQNPMMSDEDRHRFIATMEDNYVNPAMANFGTDAANAAIQAQQKGMAQQSRYEDLLAQYNATRPKDAPDLYGEPIGPAAPVATQNYGSYYDGRSGNGGVGFATNRMLEQEDRKDAYSSAPYRSGYDRQMQTAALADAQKSASEDTLMRDTYPEMQVSSGYTGSPLSLDQQRFMYTDPLRTVTPGKEGGVYTAANGTTQTPSKQEIDDAYEAYKSGGGIMYDVSRGYDDQEDRKYSYSPDQTYNSQSGIAAAINQWQQNKDTRNALGAQTFNSDQQYQALYNALLSNGLSKEDIMSMSGGEELPNLTPEQNMMLYYYAMNH